MNIGLRKGLVLDGSYAMFGKRPGLLKNAPLVVVAVGGGMTSQRSAIPSRMGSIPRMLGTVLAVVINREGMGGMRR